MTPQDPRAAPEADPQGRREASARFTLPPPDIEGQKSARPERPTAAGLRTSNRPAGAVAPEATLRARFEEGRRTGDVEVERLAATQLARWLGSNGRDLDQAVVLATRALAIKDDTDLRRDLASWLEGLGDAAHAAEVIAAAIGPGHVSGEDSHASSLLVRVGVLSARAAEAGAASAAFVRAERADQADALPCELRGSLAAWAPEIVSPEQAAVAYLAAAARREQVGAIDAQLENLWRAFDAHPASEDVAVALAAALMARGRASAADEAMRAHASTLRGSDAARVHARRRADAIAGGDVPRALAAALDEGLDAEIDADAGGPLDDLLVRAGLVEALAVRLELRAERTGARGRAHLLEELGRLYAGSLAMPERAIDAFALAMAVDPTRTEALVALRAHAAQRRDPGPLVDALIRALGGDAAAEGDGERSQGARIACARTLLRVADEQLGDPALAAWAAERLLRLDGDDVMARAAVARAELRRPAAREKLELARAALADAKGSERLTPLRALAAALRGAPLEGAARSRVLAEIAERTPQDRGAVTEAYRASTGRGDWTTVCALADVQLRVASETWQRVEARRHLAAEARSRNAWREASLATAPLLEEARDNRLAASIAWVHASIAGDRVARACALEAIAESCTGPLRASLLGVAASAFHEAGDDVEARRVAEDGAVAEPGVARPLSVLAEAAGTAPDRDATAAYERAIAAMGPRASWCEALAGALERCGNPNDAFTWTQRLVALKPGDPAAIEVLVRRAVKARDASRLADAIGWSLSVAQPAGSLAGHVAGALHDLVEIDAERAGVVARRALDVFGPRHDALREALMAAAEAARDEAFAASILERWIAIGAPSADRGELHAQLVKRRARMGDRDGEARAIERAMRDGFDVRGFEANLDALAETKLGPDTEIAFLEARATLAMAKGEMAVAATTLRQLGASLWELARDRAGAARAFVRAAAITGNAGALGADLARFDDPAFALSVLEHQMSGEPIVERAGALAAEAARAALALGDSARAFELAASALARNPSLADALAIAEQGSISAGRAVEMSPLYDAVGARALGRFGRRAAHYRAARFFEQRDEPRLALKHAAEAFTAVPSEGTTFLLLARAAERAAEPGVAVSTIERVAEQSRVAERRAAWLLRAATLLGRDEEGLRQKVEVLLRAALAMPTLTTIALLADAARAFLTMFPDEREPLLLRFGRAAHKLTEGVEGPDGARVAIVLSSVLLDVFADVDAGGDLALRALGMDADLDEYARLIPFAARLAASDGAAALLARAVALCEQPYANVGAPAWRLVGAIAEAAGDHGLHCRAIVNAAVRDPDDDALVRAADGAVRDSGDPGLLAKLSKSVSPDRRAEALTSHARELRREGANELAIDPYERALELLGGGGDASIDHATLEAELREACEAAGRTEHLEERALRAATAASLAPMERAERWEEIAAMRELRGDLSGAASARFEAAVLEPGSLERWSSLERAATDARRHDLRAHALEEIASRVPPGARIDVVRRLARAYEEASEIQAAENAWQEVWEGDPDDEEADRALEAIFVGRGDYAALADHLGRRADRLSVHSGKREALRAVRFRRAVILEQRLNRAQDAADELSLLLTESPDNEAALSYLADLYERMGASEKAAPLWRKAAMLAREPSRQMELELRAAAASRGAGDLSAAMKHIENVLAQEPSHRQASALHVDLARAAGDDGELGRALERLAAIADDEGARADLLVEAAQAAARANDARTAIVRAQRAAKIAPTRASAQLYARGLEYRVRGAGSPEDARQTIEELGRVGGHLGPDDAALQAFLLAEAFDARQGGGAGLHRLTAVERQIGPHAVLSVGLAERLVAQWKFAEAVPHFTRAIGGDLLGLRKRGTVALAGADAALRVEDHDTAMRFLDLAAAEPDSRAAALRKLATIVTAKGDVTRSRTVLLELARTAGPEDRARTLAQLARVMLVSGSGEERADALRIFDEAVAAAPEGSVLRVQLLNELEALRKRPSLHPRSAAPEEAPPEPARQAKPTNLEALEREAKDAQTPSQRARARVALARAHVEAGAFDRAEPLLSEALGEGSAEAGELLASILERDATRTGERLRVWRRLVDLVPGHVARLEGLRAAALADRNAQYARAIEHVLRAFDPGAGPLPPPPLTGQVEQPGLLAHLARPAREAHVAPFALLWESAHAVFAKAPTAYAITGVERITPGSASTSPVARLYDATLRLLGAPVLPLFHRRTNAPIAGSVALMHPAAALLTGDAHEDTTELRHALGSALAGALPAHVLLLGLPEPEVRTLWGALLAAFGPPDQARGVEKEASKLAERLWTTVPPRAQRRLKELLAGSSGPDVDLALAAARQSARRVALFVAGDFGFAARAYLDERKGPDVTLSGDELRVACAEHAPLADLLRLAVSPEFAEARWHPVAPGSQRGTPSTSRRAIL